MICCLELDNAFKIPNIPIGYSAALRECYLYVTNINIFNEKFIDMSPKCCKKVQLLYYCPFCGRCLPDSLRDKWYDTLVSFGYEEPWEDEIPEEFKNDSWYKNNKNENILKKDTGSGRRLILLRE